MRCTRLYRKLATDTNPSQQDCEGAKSIQTSIHQVQRAGTSTSLFLKSHDHVGERHENNLKVIWPGSPLFASAARLIFGRENRSVKMKNGDNKQQQQSLRIVQTRACEFAIQVLISPWRMIFANNLPIRELWRVLLATRVTYVIDDAFQDCSDGDRSALYRTLS